MIFGCATFFSTVILMTVSIFFANKEVSFASGYFRHLIFGISANTELHQESLARLEYKKTHFYRIDFARDWATVTFDFFDVRFVLDFESGVRYFFDVQVRGEVLGFFGKR